MIGKTRGAAQQRNEADAGWGDSACAGAAYCYRSRTGMSAFENW
jgi:hypothetical protein